MSQQQAIILGVDITTSELALAVRDVDGNEGFAATKMRGAIHWRDDRQFPGFDLAELPGMINELLDRLESDGWNFSAEGPATRMMSVACRQHDMVLLDQGGEPLLPALSWQCNVATAEVGWLREQGVEQTVGPIAERFVLPKLRSVLNREPSFCDRLSTVFMTGDWLAMVLTGERTVSASDALSNGLLDQSTRRKDDAVFQRAGFSPAWFPAVVRSGEVIGPVLARSQTPAAWTGIAQRLQGWRFVAGLGDNHASAVGCGMTDDYRTLVVSAGTSGTINYACSRPVSDAFHGDAMRFEFYDQGTLLLAMLADCAAWYNRFLDEFSPGPPDHQRLNEQAAASDWQRLRRIAHDDRAHVENYPADFRSWSLAEQVAATQFSIVLELLVRTRDMIRALPPSSVRTFVLTGGLSQSTFFQQVFRTGVELLAPGAEVRVSARSGPLRYKTSAYGAMINAELPLHPGGLAAIHAQPNLFPQRECAAVADSGKAETLRSLLRASGM
jgi:sugar (pentulose or hexulose) kinase